MSLKWSTPPPPPVDTPQRLRMWCQALWNNLRDTFAKLFTLGSGLAYNADDGIKVNVDNSTITVDAANVVAATGCVPKAAYTRQGVVLVGTGTSTYTQVTATLDWQVLSTNTATTPETVVWQDPLYQYTLCFASSTGASPGTATVGQIDRISTNGGIRVPTGYTLKVLAAWGSLRTGATVGTYKFRLIINNKTTGTDYTLVTGTSAANLTASMFATSAIGEAVTVGVAGDEILLGFKNDADSVAALAGGPHQMYVQVIFV